MLSSHNLAIFMGFSWDLWDSFLGTEGRIQMDPLPPSGDGVGAVHVLCSIGTVQRLQKLMK